MTQKTINNIVKNIIKELLQRKGFDDWYDTIEPEIQIEIQARLQSIVAAELNYNATEISSKYPTARDRYHKMLDYAMDTTPEGCSFVGNFVQQIIDELISDSSDEDED